MIPFLLQTAHTVCSKHEHLTDVIFILPSKRAKVYLLNHLLQQTDVPKFAPQIFSIEEFIASLSQLKRAPQLELVFALYSAYAKCMPEGEKDCFEKYLQWSSKLLKDFNDIDAYQINADSILENLAEYYQLEEMNLSETAFDQNFWNALPQIYHEFRTSLLENDWGTMGMLYREALDTLEIYLNQTEKYHYFVGFNALNTSEEYLFQEFLAAEKGEVLWDLDASFFNDTQHASARFIRKYQHEWNFYRKQPISFHSTPYASHKKITALGFTGSVAQAQYVGHLLREKKIAKDSTAVVLGNEKLLLPVLAHLPQHFEDWNVTMGYAIDELPVVHFVIDFITMHAERKEDKFKRHYIKQLLDFAPLRKTLGSDSPNLKHEIQSLRQFSSGFFTTKDYPHFLQHPLGEKIIITPETSDSFIEHVIVLLHELEPFLLNDQLSKAAITLLNTVLQQTLAQLRQTSISVSISALAHLLQEAIKMQNIDFKGDPIKGVQLMGMLETRVLDFSTLIITNVNEGILPVGKKDQSFFPFALKKHFGLPTYLDNDSIYAYHFYRLIQRASTVYLFYNANSDGLDAGEKSRFIRQLAFHHLPQHQFIDYQPDQHLPPIENKTEAIPKTSPIIYRLKELAAKGFSPTSLSSYLVNPMDFYDRYILGLKPPPDKTDTLSDFKRGEIVHNTLEQLYTPYIGKEMRVSFYDQMHQKVPEIMLENFKVLGGSTIPLHGENYLIIAAYQRAVQQFLLKEKDIITKGNTLVIVSLEEEFKVNLEDSSLLFPVQIGGKIDRVDRFNGQLRFIDYKTGIIEKSKLLWSDWDKLIGNYKYQPLFQILVYAWSQAKNYNDEFPFEAGIISLKSPEAYVIHMHQKGLQKGKSLQAIDAEFIHQIHRLLILLVQEIFDEKKCFVSLEK